MKHKTLPSMRITEECPEGCVTCWGFAVPIPSLADMRKKSAYTKSLLAVRDCEGFIGSHPNIPYNVLAIFDTENNAKRAMNRAEATGMPTSGQVSRFFIEEPYYRAAKDFQEQARKERENDQ